MRRWSSCPGERQRECHTSLKLLQNYEGRIYYFFSKYAPTCESSDTSEIYGTGESGKTCKPWNCGHPFSSIIFNFINFRSFSPISSTFIHFCPFWFSFIHVHQVHPASINIWYKHLIHAEQTIQRPAHYAFGPTHNKNPWIIFHYWEDIYFKISWKFQFLTVGLTIPKFYNVPLILVGFFLVKSATKSSKHQSSISALQLRIIWGLI